MHFPANPHRAGRFGGFSRSQPATPRNHPSPAQAVKRRSPSPAHSGPLRPRRRPERPPPERPGAYGLDVFVVNAAKLSSCDQSESAELNDATNSNAGWLLTFEALQRGAVPRVTVSHGKLSCRRGGWSGNPASYSYRWLVAGKPSRLPRRASVPLARICAVAASNAPSPRPIRPAGQQRPARRSPCADARRQRTPQRSLGDDVAARGLGAVERRIGGEPEVLETGGLAAR
jgi:hypothetical protein